MDSKDREEIYRCLPHRPPFLWVDRILSLTPDTVETEKHIPADLDVFKGHYPHYPIMPGVLLCEAVFQSGAILITHGLANADAPPAGVPVLTRITNAKFKREVRPGETIRIQASLIESLGSAWFLKGKVLVRDKVALKVEFGCILAEVKQERNTIT